MSSRKTKEQRTRWRRRTGSSEGIGKGTKRRWTSGEDRLVREARTADAILAESIGRSVSAIHQRRIKLRRLNEGETP